MIRSHGSQVQKINIALGATRDVRITLIDSIAGTLIPNAAIVGAGGIAAAIGCEFMPGNADPSLTMAPVPLIEYAGPIPGPWAPGDNCGYLYTSVAAPIDGQMVYRIGVGGETAALGYNGRIRFFDLGAMGPVIMEEVWIEFNVVRMNDSQFQNVVLGSQEVVSDQLKMYPQSALGGGNYVLFDLFDAFGNPTSVQPTAREYNSVVGTIPD